jgi:hypothetical protein
MENDGFQQKKKPTLVWIIFVFYGLSAIWSLLWTILIYSGIVKLNSEQATYFNSFTLFDNILAAFIYMGHLTGAVFLFRLRKAAFLFFLVSLIANISSTAWHVTQKGWVAKMGGPTFLFGHLVGLGFISVVCIYIRRLQKQGILR